MGLHKGQTNSGSFKKGQTSPRKGASLSEETKNKISIGVSIARTGTHHTQETKDKIAATEWRGGHEASQRRSDAQRRGFEDSIALNKWYLGSARHHITNNYVVYIPKELHQKFGGHKREVHRRLVMEALEQELPILFNDITMYLWNSTEIPTGVNLSD